MNRRYFFSFGIIASCLLVFFVNGNIAGESNLSPTRDIPSPPVRQPAEFEPMQGVLIRYSFGISYQIIAEMSEDVEVVTIVTDSVQQAYVETQYQTYGVNLSNCHFLLAPTDTYWTRDYGPWFIYMGTTEQAIIDFTYNRPRPNDDAIPLAYGNDQNITVYDMGLVHTGGNYMTDGHGIAVSTDLVRTENPGFTHEMINQTVLDYLGITTYHVVPDVLGQYIKHIDCWAKYLSPDTLMIIQVPPSHSQYDEIEAAVQYFGNQTSCYGTPYTITRVYTPNGEPYINSLILNSKVFVPITGSSWDDDALAAYVAAMPGYEIMGFTGSWQTTDALHCRVKEIPDRYMLYIDHIPLSDQEPTPLGFPVEATIIPYSGTNLTPPSLNWRVEGNWESLLMTNTGPFTYTGYIPVYPNGTQISYYLHAEDNSGRSENHPYIGEPGAHTFTALTQPPHIQNMTLCAGWNLITVPVGNMWTAESLADNITGCSVVLMFNVTTQTFLTHVVGTPWDDFLIMDGVGYFIYVTTTSIITLQDIPITNVTVPIAPGWNIIGWYHDYTTTAEYLGDTISGSSVVLMFDAQTQTFLTHVVDTPWDNFTIERGMGLFIYTTESSVWHGDG